MPEIELMIEKYPSQSHWNCVKDALILLGEKQKDIEDLISKEKKEKIEFSNVLKRFKFGVEDHTMIQLGDKSEGVNGFIYETSEIINKCIRERHDFNQEVETVKK